MRRLRSAPRISRVLGTNLCRGCAWSARTRPRSSPGAVGISRHRDRSRAGLASRRSVRAAIRGASLRLGFRRDQHGDTFGGEVVHLLAVPVAGVCECHARRLRNISLRELLSGGAEHQLQMPEVGRIHRALGGDDDLVLAFTISWRSASSDRAAMAADCCSSATSWTPTWRRGHDVAHVHAILELVTDDVHGSTDATIESRAMVRAEARQGWGPQLLRGHRSEGPVTEFTPLSLASNDGGEITERTRDHSAAAPGSLCLARPGLSSALEGSRPAGESAAPPASRPSCTVSDRFGDRDY